MSKWQRVTRVLGVTIIMFQASTGLAETLTGSGSWASNRYGSRGDWTMDASKGGDSWAGGMSLTGSPVFKGGSVQGMTLKAERVTFGLLEDGSAVATFNGTLDGDTVSGTYQSAADEGTWSGKLQTSK